MRAGRRWAAWPSALWLLGMLAPSPLRAEELVLSLGGDIAYPEDAPDPMQPGGASLFADIQPLLDDSDLRFANLECPLSDGPARTDVLFPMICSPQRIGRALDAGFDLLSLANNHITDAGLPGVLDTVSELRLRAERRPLWWAGVGAHRAEAARPASVRLATKHTTVAFFAVFDLALHGVDQLRDPTLRPRIAAAAAEHDVVLVSVHTGVEYSERPLAETARRLRELIDAGADLVVGHHPHVAQGVERYAGGVIFHSLGNLSFASRGHRHVERGVLPLSLLGRVRFRDGALGEVELVPLYTGNTTAWELGGEVLEPTFAAPRRLEGPFADAAYLHLEQLSATLPEAPATELFRRDGRLFVRLARASDPSREGSLTEGSAR